MENKADIKSLKKAKRSEIKAKSQKMSREEINDLSKIIAQRLLNTEEYKNAKTVFCFVSTPLEPQTEMILKDALSSKKRLCVPLCIKKGIMEAKEINSMDVLKEGSYGILEPPCNLSSIEPKDIDFAVIPCVSADRNLNRLGHGGGYYDRFLCDGNFIKAIICFEEMLLDDVPKEDTDVTCDMLITEEKIYRKK